MRGLSYALFFTILSFLTLSTGWSEADREHLGQELSDVLIYLVRLADRCHVDLPAAVLSKLVLNAKKYPASKVYGSSQKYTAYSDSSQSN